VLDVRIAERVARELSELGGLALQHVGKAAAEPRPCIHRHVVSFLGPRLTRVDRRQLPGKDPIQMALGVPIVRDPAIIEGYLTDASNTRGTAEALVRPRSTDEV